MEGKILFFRQSRHQLIIRFLTITYHNNQCRYLLNHSHQLSPFLNTNSKTHNLTSHHIRHLLLNIMATSNRPQYLSSSLLLPTMTNNSTPRHHNHLTSSPSTPINNPHTLTTPPLTKITILHIQTPDSNHHNNQSLILLFSTISCLQHLCSSNKDSRYILHSNRSR